MQGSPDSSTNPPHHTLYIVQPLWEEDASSTFHEDARGKANDLGQDGEEGPDTGPLRLPVL